MSKVDYRNKVLPKIAPATFTTGTFERNLVLSSSRKASAQAFIVTSSFCCPCRQDFLQPKQYF